MLPQTALETNSTHILQHIMVRTQAPSGLQSVVISVKLNLTPFKCRKGYLFIISSFPSATLCCPYHIDFSLFQVWDACSDAYISFDPSKEFGNSSLDMGYIVENPVTIAALQKQLEELDSRVKIFYGTKLKNLILPSIARDLV